LATLAAGCSRGPAQSTSVEQNLRHIGMAYDRASKKGGRLPRSTEELKPALQRFGDPEAILVSPNDGQPFTIRWDVPVFRPGPKGVFPILAYEAVGVDGKKYVLDNMLGVRQMTEAELDQALQANK
jgi:hypothetical protein